MESTAEQIERPALTLSWRPWFGDDSVQVAVMQTALDDPYPWGMECHVHVRWDGKGWFMVKGVVLPSVRFGADLETGKVEAERRLRLLVEALGGAGQ